MPKGCVANKIISKMIALLNFVVHRSEYNEVFTV